MSDKGVFIAYENVNGPRPFEYAVKFIESHKVDIHRNVPKSGNLQEKKKNFLQSKVIFAYLVRLDKCFFLF